MQRLAHSPFPNAVAARIATYDRHLRHQMLPHVYGRRDGKRKESFTQFPSAFSNNPNAVPGGPPRLENCLTGWAAYAKETAARLTRIRGQGRPGGSMPLLYDSRGARRVCGCNTHGHISMQWSTFFTV